MKPVTEAAIWDAYNLLLLGPDVERLRKLLARHELFRLSQKVPGDIVECGVFKGSGLLFWLKLLQIYSPGSARRVIGFDMFSQFGQTQTAAEAKQVAAYVKESSFNGVTTDGLYQQIAAAGIARTRCELIAGDITVTAQEYVNARPGLRIALLHLDLDLEAATFAALEAFWPHVVRGGLVVFDEYGAPQWTESNAVDRFFADKPCTLQTLNWANTPSAFLVKE
ncbi:MAG: TylF/MycF/NovP-related O-methyltransferase [Blastocatellia bacterium]